MKKFSFLFLFVLILLPFVYSYTFTNSSYKKLELLWDDCYTTAYDKLQHPSDNHNCTNIKPINMDSNSYYRNETNQCVYANNLFNVSLNDTYYSIKFFNLTLGADNYQTNPKNMELYINGVLAYNWSDTYLSGGCTSGTSKKSHKFFNTTSYDVPSGFDSFLVHFGCPNTDTCNHPSAEDDIYRVYSVNAVLSSQNVYLNQLPSFNVTANSTYKCIGFNESFPVTIPIELNAIDPEGDTIYYGVGQQEINRTYFNDFNNWIGFMNMPDYSVLDKSFTAACDFDDVLSNSDTKHKLVSTFDAVDDEVYALQLNGFCNETDKSVVNKFEGVGKAISWSTELGDFDEGDDLNITFTDGSFDVDDRSFKFYVTRTSSRYIVDAIDSDGDSTRLFNVSSPYEYLRISLSDTVSDPTNVSVRLLYSSTGISMDTYAYSSFNTNVSDLAGVVYEPGPNNRINLDYVDYTLISYATSFSTSELTSVTFERPGYNHYYFTVSDSVHQPTDYTTDSIWIEVEQKKYCYTQGTDTVTDTIFGNPFSNFIDYLNLRSIFRKMMYVLYFFLTIWFTYLIYEVSPFKNIKIPLASLLSSVICFIFAYVTKESTATISFIVIAVLSGIFTAVQK